MQNNQISKSIRNLMGKFERFQNTTTYRDKLWHSNVGLEGFVREHFWIGVLGANQQYKGAISCDFLKAMSFAMLKADIFFHSLRKSDLRNMLRNDQIS